jgi:hypothetical protein
MLDALTNRQLCVAVKKKILVYSGQGAAPGSFVARREVGLPETPRAMLCTADACCLALK